MKFITILITCIVMSLAIVQDTTLDYYDQIKIIVKDNPETEVEKTYYYGETYPANEVVYRLLSNDFKITIAKYSSETTLIIADQHDNILLYDKNSNGIIDEDDVIMTYEQSWMTAHATLEPCYLGHMGKYMQRGYTITDVEYPVKEIYPFIFFQDGGYELGRKDTYIFTNTMIIPPPLEMIKTLLKSVIKSSS